MACNNNLVFISCEYSGIGFTSKAVPEDATRIQLMKGHGKNFPPVTKGSHFYITVEGCNSCCETMRVVGVDGDVLEVERNLGDSCTCIKSNAKVSYTSSNKEFFEDINGVIPLNVQSPLKFDCATNTLSVDCSALFKAGCGGGCDCGEGGCDECGDNPNDAGTTSGLRGPKGEKGDEGPLPTAINISPLGVLTFTYPDGTIIQATGRVPKGPKGDKGDNGETGRQGDAGAAGDSAAKISLVKVDGRDLVFTLSDDSVVRAQNAIPAPVKGDKGDKGDNGDPAAQMVNADGTWYIYAVKSTALRVNVSNTDLPVTTNAEGLARVDLSPYAKGSLVKIYNGTNLIGIGVV